MIGVDEVAQLAAHQGACTLRVFANHHLVPDTHALQTIDLDQRKPLYVADKRGHIDGGGHGRFKAAWAFDGFGHAGCGQSEMPGSLQLPQCFVAAANLVMSACVREVEMLAQCFGQRAAIDMRVAGKLIADDFNRLGLCEGSLDLVLLLHP